MIRGAFYCRLEDMMKHYDIIVAGSGAGGVFLAYELTRRANKASVLFIDKGASLSERLCPISLGKTKNCIKCKPCHIMNGYGGAGGLSDGKYNITTEFGGDLHKYIGEDKAMELMEYVDSVICDMGGAQAKLYSTSDSDLKTKCLQNDLHLLQAKVRHLGTDRNLKILGNIYNYIKDRVDILFRTEVTDVDLNEDGSFTLKTVQNGKIADKGADEIKSDDGVYTCSDLVLATGRSGSQWISNVCDKFGIVLMRNRVDIGVRVELPAEVLESITDQVYESKIVYQTKKYGDLVRTFCMNPHGEVVSENTGGIVTVNGHSYASKDRLTENTNFALLVSNTFTDPFQDSNEYGTAIASLSNMLGGGVLMQRFGDLEQGRRSSERRMQKCFTRPTLNATAGDLSLVIPKRQLDDIIEMIYALDKIAPGVANEDTLLYGVEVKFYNSRVSVDSNLMTKVPNMYAIGDGSGVTHSLSQASASGVYVARILADKYRK